MNQFKLCSGTNRTFFVPEEALAQDRTAVCEVLKTTSIKYMK